MGKLGLPVALGVESVGNRVVGYDPNQEIAVYLATHQIPYEEKDIQKLLNKNKIEFLSSIEEVVMESDIIFCAVQTPHEKKFEGDTRLPLNERADFDYSYLVGAIKEVVAAAEKLDRKTQLVVISTCLPGTFRREIQPLLTDKIKYLYNPFFIAMGTVLDDFFDPEFILIGTEGENADDLVEFYTEIHGRAFEPRFVITDTTTAEGIKVFYNTFITTKTVLANMYGEFCHHLGMNVDDVFKAMSLANERLISTKYLKAGVGDGGGCHPRDNIALSYLADKVGLSHNFFEDIMRARENHMRWLAAILFANASINGMTAVVLGKSFKPETNITTGSPAMLVMDILTEYKSLNVQQYEFDLPEQLSVAVYLIATQHQAYEDIKFPEGSIVIDPFRYIKKQEGVQLVDIGGKRS